MANACVTSRKIRSTHREFRRAAARRRAATWAGASPRTTIFPASSTVPESTPHLQRQPAVRPLLCVPLSSRQCAFLPFGLRTSMFQRSHYTLFSPAPLIVSHLCFFFYLPTLYLSLARWSDKTNEAHRHTRASAYTTVRSAASRRPAYGSDIAEEQRRTNAPTRLNATSTATRSLRPARSHSLACLSAWNSSPPRAPCREYPHPLGLYPRQAATPTPSSSMYKQWSPPPVHATCWSSFRDA